MSKRIIIATDAWAPQVNGVVRTLGEVTRALEDAGHELTVIAPHLFRSIPCPTYPEIRLAINLWPKLTRMIREVKPDHIHIPTEGPIGLATRNFCQRNGLRFTSAFHTKFPEYIEKRFLVPASWSYRFLRWFHGPSEAMMVATPTLQRELESRGFTNCRPWTRGVDTTLFHPSKRQDLGYERPVHCYVGRVAVEKNIEAFLSLDLPGTKLVVGDGPARAEMQSRFPEAVFVGAKHGEELAVHYASSDVFIFPSKTDTFGLVMLEAMASGLPVAAYPVVGPIDVVKDASAGILHEELGTAIAQARELKREDARRYAEGYSWAACAKMLEEAFVPCGIK